VNKLDDHIYVVDDDAAFRKSLVRLLKSFGYFVESFPSAQSFLDSVPVDYKTGVLILDLRMPAMNGFELQQKLKEYRSTLKIIFITADAQPGDRDHAILQGAIGFLQKPFHDKSLVELIQEAFEKTNNY
jgi:FixJ family two-component response regulator